MRRAETQESKELRKALQSSRQQCLSAQAYYDQSVRMESQPGASRVAKGGARREGSPTSPYVRTNERTRARTPGHMRR